ncbi:tail fiber domain-containing protein [Lutibacter sp.]|uniref:tail fiber domain-containing protein n=1 Tax=Lutibacter sp. TaxID=1925666 RepID=UPI0025B9F1E9|nr:tail fiber domain-containing protein [Lutibacter sp.]MCF6182598.1 tail fiber domain-containing protein [Lutibacter sp.]
MKPQKSILTVLLLFIALTTIAQQGINYKALIKDSSGNVLASSPVTIQFIIYQGTALATATNVYQESHTVNTDANGIVIVNIGQGTTSDIFANINWGIDRHFLNVQVNTGTGLVDLGTTEFMSVPYAKHATTATTALNTESANNGLTIDGSTVIDNGAGWHRSYGATGWYNGTYGGGIYMKNSTWVEVYSKSFLVPSGTFQVGNIGNSTFRVANGNVGIGTDAPSEKLQIVGGNIQLDEGQGIRINNTGSYSTFKTVGANTNITSFSGGNINLSTSPYLGYAGGGSLTRLTVGSNGNVGIGTITPTSKLDVNGVLRASGNTWPTTGAGVEIAYDPSKCGEAVVGGCLSYGVGYVQTYDRDTNTWKDLSIGASSLRPLSDNFTSLGTYNRRWIKVYAVNGTIQTSDRRLKKEINNINYGLNTVMKLRPVTYKWKKGNQDVNLGLIAQEVQKLIPEMVDVGTDKKQTLGLKYTELIPVLIKGMQEQQKEIAELKKMVNKLLKQRILVSN